MPQILNVDMRACSLRLRSLVAHTPLMHHKRLSEKYECNIYLKREDLQSVRSYKIRGALNKLLSLSSEQLSKGVTCASAGNHAQGVAHSCIYLKVHGSIFMPSNTPAQKIERVKSLGGKFVKIFLTGETYDECAETAAAYCENNNTCFIHPFDDERIIEGQATVAMEISEDLNEVDYVFVPVGGGGLAAGMGYFFHQYSPDTIMIGVEPEGAASMTAAFESGKPVRLEKIDPFVDGAAVSKVGQLTYEICREILDDIHTVAEGKVCSVLLSMYNEDGILTEPAGVLSIAALDDYAEMIKGKNVVCILSGSNNDSNRMEEIKKLADAWEGLQHYLIVRFHHNPDGLKEFFSSILGPNDYVNRIEYVRRDHGRSTYALLGIRCKNHTAYAELAVRLKSSQTEFREVKKEDFLFKYWV
ncbi:MAG TPA: threonine ammonia-lyase IlvA [Chitinophagaceae bacterium]|nr:threonine ammonia-lyase IlvA [Chitinophagaceae bacterium]